MKRLIKSLCFMMAAVMLFTTTAFAAESKASNYFMMTSTYIDRVSDTELEIWFDVVAVGQMDKLGVERIKLQRSTNGTSWTTIKTYDMDDYPEMICENTASHSDYVTFSTAQSRYYYRAYVEFYAKKGNGSSMYPVYTATV